MSSAPASGDPWPVPGPIVGKPGRRSLRIVVRFCGGGLASHRMVLACASICGLVPGRARGEEVPLASLTIRKLDDQTYECLKDRAARDGVSMEEEARRILDRAVAPPGRLGDLFLATFGPERGVGLRLPRRKPHAPPALE
jgi:plasmid stability protein